jgi:phosphoglucosamine mutase
MENLDINVETTAVGDRYVLEKMLSDDHALGGEQSGHIILRHYANTGDGILTALHIMQAIKNSGRSLQELAQVMEKYPQVLINVKDVAKENLASSLLIAQLLASKNEELQGNGRILVRASGTESLVRVMVEAQSFEVAEQVAQEIAALVRSELSRASNE